MKSGDRIGNFVVEDKLGDGGFTVVYRAHNSTEPTLRRAFKVLRRELRDDAASVNLFMREANAIQAIDSPNVGKVFDVGQLPDGRPYLAMELLEGETLAEFLRREPLDEPLLKRYLNQLCDALEAVHRAGVVHRDLKPANVIITSAKQLKLVDFNVAKRVTSSVGTTLSSGDHGPGTPHYMSPEQITEPGTVDHTADLWALGVVVFEMATSQRPFVGASVEEIKMAVVRSTAPPLLPEKSAWLQPLINGCLVEKSKRFRNIAALREALGALRMPTTEPIGDRPPSAYVWPHGQSMSARFRDRLARSWGRLSTGCRSDRARPRAGNPDRLRMVSRA
jgi:eukaryotic-like serine/threonine-protein kinase